jgi:mono/diheme cytochrome c family protein
MAGINGASKPVENYRPLLWLGTALAGLMLLAMSLYWLRENPRLASAAGELAGERVQRGSEVYTAQCTGCHGVQGEGGVGPALNNRAVLKNTQDAVFFSVIRSGVPNTQMPSWSVDFGGPLTDDEIRDLVAFLRAWEPAAPEVVPAVRQPDPAQGALLFSSTCSMCHGEDGQGGKAGIPAINDPAHLERFDDTWYRQTIANGRPAKGMPTWGTVLSPAQIDDLVALLAAWREGKVVTPSYSVTSLLDQALYAVAQDDLASARLVAAQALEITSGPAAGSIQEALDLLQAGDGAAAQAALQDLQAGWPLGDPAAGEKTFAAQCASCHGAQGEGGIGKALKPNSFVQGQTNADLVAFLQTGRAGTAMTGFKDRLSEGELADVVAFLRTWQK